MNKFVTVSYGMAPYPAHLVNCLRKCDKLIQAIPLDWQFSTDNRSEIAIICLIYFGANRSNDSGNEQKHNFQIHCLYAVD